MTDLSTHYPVSQGEESAGASALQVVLVYVQLADTAQDGDRDALEDLAEFTKLASAAGIENPRLIKSVLRKPTAKLFIGHGKAQEIKEIVSALNAELVVFNQDLSPGQERNLARFFQCRVIDRVSLILDIFAQRARTFEGKLQVELAQLRHLSTRLVRGWTHLERQKGGVGLRGPGETQLETDRRLVRRRISMIEKRLRKVRSQRAQGRRSRRRAALPTIAFVGYTNAGKSTLFNRLTKSSVYVADQLFATLDPTLRRLHLKGFGDVVLADTVGFIRYLPHDLVEAFRATLEEVNQADLLLHVVDASMLHQGGFISDVERVLDQISATGVPRLLVYNKLDLSDPPQAPRIDYNDVGVPYRVWISATTGSGIPLLLKAIAQRLGSEIIKCEIHLKPFETKRRAKIHSLGQVLSETFDESGGCHLLVRIAKMHLTTVKPDES